MTKSMYNRIIEAYDRAESITGTMKATGIPYPKVRKALITAGLCETENWRRIRDYLERGYTPEQICAEMHISASTYSTHTPYTEFDPETPTPNARRIRKCRERKAADNEKSGKD